MTFNIHHNSINDMIFDINEIFSVTASIPANEKLIHSSVSQLLARETLAGKYVCKYTIILVH